MNFLLFRRRRYVATTTKSPNDSNPILHTADTQARMTDIFVERVSNASDMASIIFGSITAAAVLLAWFSAKEDAKRKDNALERYKEDAKVEVVRAKQLAAEAHERAAQLEKEAELARAEIVRMNSRMQRRRVPFGLFETLKTSPKGQASMWFSAHDDEAKEFAVELWRYMAGAGWTVSQPQPTPEFEPSSILPWIKYPGVTIWSADKGAISPSPENPMSVLMNALAAGGINAKIETESRNTLTALPEGIVILIGPRF